jgi:site-specific DNA-methyltransferase (adenine-specific)
MIDLRLGNCLQVMKTIEDNSIDAIITDPPYGTTSCKWDSIIDLELMWIELNRIIKPTGAIVLFAQQPFSSVLIVSNIKKYRHKFVWQKDKCANFMTAKAQPLKYTEDILVFCEYGFLQNQYKNTIGTYNPQMTYVENKGFNSGQIRGETMKEINLRPTNTNFKSDPNKDPKSRFPKDTIFFKVPKKGKVHPTQKPVELMEYLIKTYTNENETVLDFTMGSGSTMVACDNLNRNGIGIEMDQSYFKIAQKRIAENKYKLSI